MYIRKQIFVEQRSPEWHELRRNLVGASEVPVLLGVQPKSYGPQSAHQLAKRKLLGLTEPDNDAMRHGVEMEPVALAKFCSVIGRELQPAVYTYGPLIASLDGYNESYGVEIKCPYRSKLSCKEYAQQDHIRAQVEAQELVAGVPVFTMVYKSDDDFWIEDPIGSKFDKDLILSSAEAFVKTLVLRDDDLWQAAEKTYIDALAASKKAEDNLEKAKQFLQMLAPEGGIGRRCSVVMRSRIGSVDYAKIPQLKGVDLDAYRKPDIKFAQIEIDEAGEAK